MLRVAAAASALASAAAAELRWSPAREHRRTASAARRTTPEDLEFNTLRWFGGDGNWGPDRPRAASRATAFSIESCPAPFRKLRLGHFVDLQLQFNSSAALERIYGAIWHEAGKVPGVTLVRLPDNATRLPDGIDAVLGSCIKGIDVQRAPTTWMLAKLTGELLNPWCSCGCGERHKRVAVLALNKAQQQLWEGAGGAAIELRLTEPPLLPCTRRRPPGDGDGPVRVCYMGFQHHGYDLVLGAIPHLLADPRVRVVLISVVTGWWDEAFASERFAARGIPRDRIEVVYGNGREAVWAALARCHVGLAPQWSNSRADDRVRYEMTFRGQKKLWQIDGMQSIRMKLQGQAGRAFMFTQIGIPVITEAEFQTLANYPEHRLGVTIEAAGRPQLWAWALRRVLHDYEGFSRRSCEFARTHLQPAVEARKLVCWLRHWQAKVEHDPEAGVVASRPPPEPFLAGTQPPWRPVVHVASTPRRRRRVERQQQARSRA